MIQKTDAMDSGIKMDPDSSLNRAHQKERQAERMFQLGRYEQATACYNRAADHLVDAMNQTRNSSALLSLRLQLENLHKQPRIAQKRQQWASRKQQAELTTAWSGQIRQASDDTADGHGEPDQGGGGATVESPADGEQTRVRTDSVESRFNSEETDSLLAMVRQHSAVEDERQGYRLSQLLTAMRTLGSQHQGDVDVSSRDQNEKPVARKPPPAVTERTVLLAQNEELRNHLVQLFAVLDSYDRENRSLKEQVHELIQELEGYRAQRMMRGEDDVGHFGVASSETRLDAPFSLMAGFAGTPPTESLPSLEPLDITSFEDI